MNCQHCGHVGAGLSAFCTNCGQSQLLQPAFAATAGGAAAIHSTTNTGLRLPEPVPYAHFLTRFIAFLLDQFIAGTLAGFTYLIMAALAAATGASGLHRGYSGGYRSGVSLGGSFLFLLLGGFLAFAVYVLYFVKQETGRKQATLGKSLLGIKITTLTGAPVSVGQSLVRLLVKDLISGLLFGLGFLIAAFTERKQALHDFVVGTIVVRS